MPRTISWHIHKADTWNFFGYSRESMQGKLHSKMNIDFGPDQSGLIKRIWL